MNAERTRKNKDYAGEMANEIIDRMIEHHLNVTQLAVLCGVTEPHLRHIMSGRRKLTLDMVKKLAEVLGITVWHLRGVTIHVTLNEIGEDDEAKG